MKTKIFVSVVLCAFFGNTSIASEISLPANFKRAATRSIAGEMSSGNMVGSGFTYCNKINKMIPSARSAQVGNDNYENTRVGSAK